MYLLATLCCWGLWKGFENSQPSVCCQWRFNQSIDIHITPTSSVLPSQHISMRHTNMGQLFYHATQIDVPLRITNWVKNICFFHYTLLHELTISAILKWIWSRFSEKEPNYWFNNIYLAWFQTFAMLPFSIVINITCDCFQLLLHFYTYAVCYYNITCIKHKFRLHKHDACVLSYTKNTGNHCRVIKWNVDTGGSNGSLPLLIHFGTGESTRIFIHCTKTRDVCNPRVFKIKGKKFHCKSLLNYCKTIVR